MIIILADDFSGAAELAGIAASRGYKAEVQTIFNANNDADVIAVDTGTRLTTEAEAARMVGTITRQILSSKPAWIYKKTDSVMRGHLRAEIGAILDASGLESCVLIPANPSKGRIIRDGHYQIDGVPLHQTVFAHDPDHPMTSSNVRHLLGECRRIHTPDAAAADDLPSQIPAHTLAAGAADFFGALLGEGVPTLRLASSTRSLLLCGSLAAWETGRAAQMHRLGFEVKTLDEPVAPSTWQSTGKLMLAIGKPENETPATLIENLIEKALPLVTGLSNLRIGLEGGATAMAFIRRMGWTRFQVIPEGHVGVGTLQPPGGPVLCVKPGSYPWPEQTFGA